MTRAPMSEADLQACVVDAATKAGWQHLHVRTTVGATKAGRKHLTATNINGWVDLLLWRDRTATDEDDDWTVIAVELKAEGGLVTDEQRQVLASLQRAGIPALVWRPSQWRSGAIEQVLFAHRMDRRTA